MLVSGSQSITGFRSNKTEGLSEDEDPSGGAANSWQLTKKLSSDYHKKEGRYFRGLSSYDTGHEFSSIRGNVIYPTWVKDMYSGWEGYPDFTAYSGILIPYVANPAYPEFRPADASEINALGAKMISMTIPTKPEASLATAMGEAREGLPSTFSYALREAHQASRGVGSEYLNFVFGWKPLMRDIQSVALAVKSFGAKTRQLQRDSGRHIRRKCALEGRSDFVDRGLAASYVAMPRQHSDYQAEFFEPSMECRVIDITRSDSWFRGAYSYLLAEGHSFFSRMERYEQQANRLLGTRMNADTIYQVTPWSWLIDWYADVGMFLRNVSALSEDSLVLRYGYVMHEQSATREYSIDNVRAIHGGIPRQYALGVPTRVSMTFQLTSKLRRRATPYGFGLKLESLSPQRWAVLGALGMTQSPTSLRGH